MSARVPMYRADAKGQVGALKAEFTAILSNVIAGADYFIMALEDAPHEIIEEYSRTLTDAEMEACFRKATGHKSLTSKAS